jgi:hypothetical protein
VNTTISVVECDMDEQQLTAIGELDRETGRQGDKVTERLGDLGLL